MTIKIRMKIGGIEVDYEGTEAFLDKKFQKLIGDVSALTKEIPAVPTENGNKNKSSNNQSDTSSSLGSFLREKKADNHNKRFLGTAVWLQEKNNSQLIKTVDVTKVMKENKQKVSKNPSRCLAQNVDKGYCEKQGDGFYVTDEGREALG